MGTISDSYPYFSLVFSDLSYILTSLFKKIRCIQFFILSCVMTVFSFAMLPCIPYEKSFFNLSTMTSIFFCAEGEHTLFLFLKWKRNWSSA